jgi:hypothetical protein
MRVAKTDAYQAWIDSLKDQVGRARVLMRGYDARWSGEVHTVVGVERQFRAPLVNPETGAASRTFELGGKNAGIVFADADFDKAIAGIERVGQRVPRKAA